MLMKSMRRTVECQVLGLLVQDAIHQQEKPGQALMRRIVYPGLQTTGNARTICCAITM